MLCARHARPVLTGKKHIFTFCLKQNAHKLFTNTAKRLFLLLESNTRRPVTEATQMGYRGSFSLAGRHRVRRSTGLCLRFLKAETLKAETEAGAEAHTVSDRSHSHVTDLSVHQKDIELYVKAVESGMS